MLIHDRDRQIVLSIARFGQLASAHITALHFSDLASETPMRRAMERLVSRNYVRRIERRLVGGRGAGSGQFVFQLGSAGHALSRRPGTFHPLRTVDYHTLAIADAYVELLKKERTGKVRIEGFTTEPDDWVEIDGAELRPDFHIEVADLGKERNVELWVEIDMGTERSTQIRAMLARYWHAYQHAAEAGFMRFPLVLFIAPDDARARELRWIIERGNKDAQELFMVSTMPEFAGLLFG